MTLSAAPGSNERRMRSASVAAARTIEGAHLGRLARLRLIRSDAGDTRDAGVVGLLLVVALLLGLIVISAGCGPPS